MQISVRLRRKFGFYISPINSPNHLKNSNVYTDELTKIFPRINSPQNIQHSHGQTPAQLVTTNNHINSDRSIDQSLVDRINLLMSPVHSHSPEWMDSVQCNAILQHWTLPKPIHESWKGLRRPWAMCLVRCRVFACTSQLVSSDPSHSTPTTIRTSSAKVIFTVRSIINNQFACKFQISHRIFRSLGPNH